MTDNNNKVWYKKELFSNALISNGAPIPFEPVPGNRGVLGLEPNDPLVITLNNFASKHRGGVVRISFAESEALRKQIPFQRPPHPQSEPLRLFNPPRKPKSKPNPVVESAKQNGYPDPEPDLLMEQPFRPTAKRLSEVLKDEEKAK